MDRLPAEILDNICADHLPKKNLFSFRSVCKAFASIGIRHTLSEVRVAYLPHTFARLKAISKHPVISQYVKTIIYQVDILLIIYSFKEYKNHMNLPVPAVPHTYSCHLSGADARTQQRHYRDMVYRDMVKVIDKSLQAHEEEALEGWKCYKDLYI